jgi:hypothetical protein
VYCHNRFFSVFMKTILKSMQTEILILLLAFLYQFVLEKSNFIFQYISNKMQRYTVYFIWNLLYMFRVVTPPIIRSAYNCIYSIWYLSHRYCYLPLPKLVEQFPDINKLCNVACCWIYIRILLRCTDL